MLILASQSPRRKEILSLMGYNDFISITSDADETVDTSLACDEIVKELALRKAKAVFKNHENDTVIGSDTIVSFNGKILGKPKDKQDAFDMLKLLSGNTHTVFTGVAVINKNSEITFCEAAEVLFDTMTDDEINGYISTGVPMDKAGAYGIQGIGCKFIKKINGDYYTVMGLPANRLYNVLKNIL